MIEYKLTLFKEVKYYLLFLLALGAFGAYFIDEQYKYLFQFFIMFILGFSLSLFCVKNLFRIKLFNIYQDEIEMADPKLTQELAEYQNTFEITKTFLEDMGKIKELDELKLRIDLYLKAIKHKAIFSEPDMQEYITKVNDYFAEIEDCVSKQLNITKNYPLLIREAFAQVIERRMHKQNKDKKMRIK